ncbi:hypothetical protein QLQ12_33075 [Actinoplanes sp. NEAU-A12]|uniref:Uncharacterized protein n=1 Tax=Actinoplanes sandaracinus TaxID=3045177 RepID=A0ABT6WUQ3_9ACTN|nr:hypothetical protein [Actinoplanes sandaracinus]MDI6103453.1 hypothetical protein [Actinoplanes sandaracinus]
MRSSAGYRADEELGFPRLGRRTAEVVLAARERTGAAATALTLELTLELTEMGPTVPETVEAALGPLRRAGVPTAVDTDAVLEMLTAPVAVSARTR